jgi:hypothetical protein
VSQTLQHSQTTSCFVSVNGVVGYCARAWYSYPTHIVAPGIASTDTLDHNLLIIMANTSGAIARITREIAQVQKGDDLSLAVACRDSDVRSIRGLIVGPPETPYEYGFFGKQYGR